MARRPGDEGRFTLSPRARLVAGWVVAALLIGGVAVFVGILGGDGDGAAVLPTPSPSSGGSPPAETIAFGTAIDPLTGEVSEASVTDTFTHGDPFAYSVRPATPPPNPIYVEVRRVGGGPQMTVQPPAPQGIGVGAELIAFVVQATDLIEEFGTGEFEMRIFATPTGEPLASGRFRLTGDALIPASPPQASPAP